MTTHEAHKFCKGNEPRLQDCQKCGCFYCMKIYSPSEIIEWHPEHDGVRTAICPYCAIDSVLSEKDVDINKEFLQSMYDQWFTVREFEKTT